MALSDGSASVEQIEQMEKILAQVLNGKIRAARNALVACSEERRWPEDNGTTWSYVIVLDSYVRITGCATAEQKLVIPMIIEDKPVLELAVDACSYLDSVREIICSDTIEKIDSCAFRLCTNLERIKFPLNVNTYDSSWVRGCVELREIELPGKLERVDASIFDIGELRYLKLGRAVERFNPGMFKKSELKRIEIDEDNPYLTTDGQAVYAHEGAAIRVLAVPCESYTVADGCRVVEVKAFANHEELQTVNLPSSITAIEDYAFAYSGLERFDAPSDLKAIGSHAFFRCRCLADLTLNDGIADIGDDAFNGTSLTRVDVPSSVEVLGKNVAANTQLTFAGEDASFVIAPGGVLEIDNEGGLYRSMPHGKHFVRMLSDDIEEYRLADGTIEIEPQAFASHAKVERVILPEGLLRIGEAAFRDCSVLARADFPSTLQEVGKEAFLDSSLEYVFIPRSVTQIGESALVTHGAHNGDCAPSLRKIEVEDGNEFFFSVPGLLCARRENSGSHVVVYADGTESVRIPDEVTVIDSYAFGGARHLRELFLNTRIHYVGMRGLSVDCVIEHIRIDLVEPIEGHEYFDLYFPDAARTAHEIQLAFNLSGSVDPRMIFKHYDSAIVNMHEFDKKSRDREFDLYGQAKLALGRLSDPVLMTSTNRIMLTQVITDNLESVCEACARHDDREAIDDLIELGLLNKDNLLGVIDKVGKLQDAAMTGYLLEVKRRLFRDNAIDFDL